jgi:hypothetical protein
MIRDRISATPLAYLLDGVISSLLTCSRAVERFVLVLQQSDILCACENISVTVLRNEGVCVFQAYETRDRAGPAVS